MFLNARLPNKPDHKWQVKTVKTRQKRRNKEKPYTILKVPSIIIDVIEPKTIKAAQEEDAILSGIRKYVANNIIHKKKNGKVKWNIKNILL